jgi:hypothetical protein
MTKKKIFATLTRTIYDFDFTSLILQEVEIDLLGIFDKGILKKIVSSIDNEEVTLTSEEYQRAIEILYDKLEEKS